MSFLFSFASFSEVPVCFGYFIRSKWPENTKQPIFPKNQLQIYFQSHVVSTVILFVSCCVCQHMFAMINQENSCQCRSNKYKHIATYVNFLNTAVKDHEHRQSHFDHSYQFDVNVSMKNPNIVRIIHQTVSRSDEKICQKQNKLAVICVTHTIS